jgi:hypothetical protein
MKSVFSQDDHDLYVIGDIHADFDVLRKCLEDCAQVSQFVWIEKKKKGKPKWIGKNAYVVLVGDVLDRHRVGAYRDEKGWGGGEYADEEYDILLYLTILNRQAVKEGGRVFATLGNHEASNIMQKEYSYASPGIVRKNREKDMTVPDGRLVRLIRECCGYGVLQIGDWVFVHGGLVPSIISKVVDPSLPIDSNNNFFTKITEAAQYLLGHESTRRKALKEQEKLQHILKHVFLPCACGGKVDARASDSFLWNDSLSSDQKEVDCEKASHALKAFIPHLQALGYSVPNPERLHIVVGHSTQTFQKNGYIYTHINRKRSDRRRIVLQGPAVHYTEKKEEKEEKRYLGINFMCPFEKNGDDGRVWRTDACMSRSFDFVDEFKEHLKRGEKDFRRYIFARQPQVLYVNAKTKKVSVIVAREGPDRSGICKQLGIREPKIFSDRDVY